MKEKRIPKGRGKWRTVYCPSDAEATGYRKLLPELAAAERTAATLAATQDVAHGFVAGRSPVTGAMLHRGASVTICCDLTSWFDSVRPAQISAGLVAAGHRKSEAQRIAREACHKNAPRQGLPSSPAAANLAAVAFDRALLDLLPAGTIYTRYADDLAVSLSASVDTPATRQAVIEAIKSVAQKFDWSVATEKTRILDSRVGRRVICGVSVGDDLRAPKRIRHRLRAVRRGEDEHRQQVAAGLTEWCKMRLPRAARSPRLIAGIAGIAEIVAVATRPAASVVMAETVVAAPARRIRLRGRSE